MNLNQNNMKVNELRIENLVYDAFNAEAIVCDITQTGININHGYSTISINELKPIPLTEEWLLKFGFIKESDYFFIKINPFGTCIYLDIEENIYQIGCENGSWYSHNAEIKHVHTLQNLYFALTGEELTFKTK